MLEQLNTAIAELNALLWHNALLYVILVAGVVFTIATRFAQYRIMTHGIATAFGLGGPQHGKGVLSHFQALSTALSATVGLGNIGGVAIAITLGGPGAIFWMWVVAVLGMAIKTIEVSLAMTYRNTEDPDNPHGGPFWVAKHGVAALHPKLAGVGTFLGGCVAAGMLLGVFAGGNMFQAWNVAEVSHASFGWPRLVTGVVLALVVGAVILGGIKRIGAVTSVVVPAMCGLYILAGLAVVAMNLGQVPALFGLILHSAFSPAESTGAFMGATAGMAFIWGMKRALFSSEIAQGSSAVAHCAVKSDEPARQGLVAGLEPLIDTLLVCTITGLVILSSGVWNRSADLPDLAPVLLPAVAAGQWQPQPLVLPQPADGSTWGGGEQIYAVAQLPAAFEAPARRLRLTGAVVLDTGPAQVVWDAVAADVAPVPEPGVYVASAGASLTALAFNQTHPWLGGWFLTIAIWAFAVSTIISWGYYGEQCVNYLTGGRWIMPYRVLYCISTVVATTGFIRTTAELDSLTTLGTGLLLIINLPITLVLGLKGVQIYREYVNRVLVPGDQAGQ